MSFSDKGIRALELARACAELGACRRTIVCVTGLAPTFVRREVFSREYPAPVGRPPYTEAFAFDAGGLAKLIVSAFCARYVAGRAAGMPPGPSLVALYREVISWTAEPAFSFDEAFYLVCLIDGIWESPIKRIGVAPCPRGHLGVVPFGATRNDRCPYCRLEADRARARASGATSFEIDMPKATRRPGAYPQGSLFDQKLRLKRFMVLAAELGAKRRAVNAMLSTLPGIPPGCCPAPPDKVIADRRPMALHLWSEHHAPRERIQFTLAALAFQAFNHRGCCPTESVLGAVRYLKRQGYPTEHVDFGQCFEVLSHVSGRWGATPGILRLVDCERCRLGLLVSMVDRKPTDCPACRIARMPGREAEARWVDARLTSARAPQVDAMLGLSPVLQ